MYIPTSLILIVGLLLWWEYCWVPAREQWKRDPPSRLWKLLFEAKPHQPKHPPSNPLVDKWLAARRALEEK